MKKIRLLTVLFILCITLLTSTYVSAISITLDNKTVKPGEEFTVKIKIDEKISLANSHISFDSNLFEFKGTTQENLAANELSAGDVAWMYTEIGENPKGVNELEFKFKAKDNIDKKEEATFKLSDLDFITLDNNSFKNDDISGDKEFKVKVQNTGSFKVFYIVIPIVIIALIAVCIIKKGKKK